ncbi:MAG: hypothetical protein V1870_01640 [Candidatus Aenigmatarchaeota archaeon]
MSFRKEKYEEWLNNSSKCRIAFKEFVKKGHVMKISESHIWSKRHLEKANHNLDFATLVADIHRNVIKENFPNQTFHDWITIAYYYAIYHAALALLANIGYKSKSHMETLCGVILYYYHKNKILDKKHIEVLKQMDQESIEQFIEAQNLRERASYGVGVSFEERLSAMAKNDAIEFVNKAKEILEK